MSCIFLSHSSVDNFEADFFVTNDIENSSLPAIGDAVVNQSFTFGPLSAADQEQVDSDYDNYSDQNKTFFISAADNYSQSTNVCAPGTSYNCISVGAYINYTYANSVGPTIDNGRCKPDITAIAGDHIIAQQTSLVGSIGVLFQFPNVSDLLDKIGVKVESIKSTPLKAAPDK